MAVLPRELDGEETDRLNSQHQVILPPYEFYLSVLTSSLIYHECLRELSLKPIYNKSNKATATPLNFRIIRQSVHCTVVAQQNRI
jgi:hypothetical protein